MPRCDALAGAAAPARRQPGALPLLPLRGAAALPARRRVGVRDRRARSMPRFSGAGSAASCSRSSASRRSTSISTRGWAPTACSIRRTCRRCPAAVLWVGVAAFAGALAVGHLPDARGGWPILAFALAGGAAAIFYEAPPIRWSYRGLGETRDRAVVRAVDGARQPLPAYRRPSWGAFWASLVPGLPHHGARRRERDSGLSSGPARRKAQPGRATRPQRAASGSTSLSPAAGWWSCGARRRRAGCFRWPASRRSSRRRCWCERAACAVRTYESPRQFLPAIRAMVTCYLVAVALFVVGILVHA